MALALGVSHPDNLRLTYAQWLGWIAYMRVRGPVGPPRQDKYAELSAIFTTGNATPHTFTDCLPWMKPEPGKE